MFILLSVVKFLICHTVALVKGKNLDCFVYTEYVNITTKIKYLKREYRCTVGTFIIKVEQFCMPGMYSLFVY